MSAISDPKRFSQFLDYFQKRYQRYEQQGGAYKLTSLGAWATARPEALVSFFQRLGLEKHHRFADLGCGDGVAVCCAAHYCQATGIEADWDLCREAQMNARALGLESRTTFVCADFLQLRLDPFDFLYIYPDKPLEALWRKIRDWTGTLLVYGPHFPPKSQAPFKVYTWERETLSVYVISASSRTHFNALTQQEGAS